MSGKTENTLLSLVTGAALGLTAGLLLAPESGKDTRKKLKKSMEYTTNEIKDKLDNFTTELKNQTQKIKGNFDENLEHLLSQTSYKADEVIGSLEKKLQQLKEANAKLQKKE